MFVSSKGALEPHSLTVLAISKMKNKAETVSLKKKCCFALRFGIPIRLATITLKTRELEKVFQK